jgi:hypothetical protein
MTKYRFIKLTFFEWNSVYPDQSGSVGKHTYQRVDLIARITPYEKSTKIRTSDGDEYEVCESVEEVTDLMNKAK